MDNAFNLRGFGMELGGLHFENCNSPHSVKRMAKFEHEAKLLSGTHVDFIHQSLN